MKNKAASLIIFIFFSSFILAFWQLSCCPIPEEKTDESKMITAEKIAMESAAFSDLCQALSTSVQNAAAGLWSLNAITWDSLAAFYLSGNPHGTGPRIYLIAFLPSTAQTDKLIQSATLCTALAAKLWNDRPYLIPAGDNVKKGDAALLQWQVINDKLLVELVHLSSGITLLKNDADRQFSAMRKYLLMKGIYYNSTSFDAEIVQYNALIDKALLLLENAQRQTLELGNWHYSSLGLPAEIKSIPVSITEGAAAPVPIIGAGEYNYFLCNNSYIDSDDYYRFFRWFPYYPP